MSEFREILEELSQDGSDVWYDSETGATVVNDTGVDSREVMQAFRRQHPEMAALSNWASDTTGSWGPSRRSGMGGLFERDRYLTPNTIFQQFKTAIHACQTDDVVSGVLESTEALAFNKVSFECEDELQQDVWNQIRYDIGLDARLREMWREVFTVSQFYVAILWGTKDFKVTGKKKVFKNLKVPTSITLLDPMKVLPVGNFLFGGDQLVYIADKTEAVNIDKVLAGYNSTDLIVNSLLQERYEPSESEKNLLKNMTSANMDNLFLFKKDAVFRHTLTKPGYERFADVRMKSVFELLDMKQQLRQMDRAYLIGATNFIILVKKGDKDIPPTQAEINQTATQIRTASRVPVIVSDHRLDIEIITPKMDNTLKPERYNTLDARITARLYQIFMSGNYAAGTAGDDSIKLARVVARGMESRRLMIADSLCRNIWEKVMERNKELTAEPELVFHPRRIALDFDPNYATYILDLRDRGDLSRDFVLTEIDVDQENEARKREREAKEFDDLFVPTNVPFSGNTNYKGEVGPDGKAIAPPTPGAPAPTVKRPDGAPAVNDPKAAGRNGGGKTGGGGMNRKSGMSQPGRGPSKAEQIDALEAYDDYGDGE